MLNELEKFCLEAYGTSSIYKKRAKKFHDRYIRVRKFAPGDRVLIFSSHLKLFPRFRWLASFDNLKHVGSGAFELKADNGSTFVVSGQRIKHYHSPLNVDDVYLMYFITP